MEFQSFLSLKLLEAHASSKSYFKTWFSKSCCQKSRIKRSGPAWYDMENCPYPSENAKRQNDVIGGWVSKEILWSHAEMTCMYTFFRVRGITTREVILVGGWFENLTSIWRFLWFTWRWTAPVNKYHYYLSHPYHSSINHVISDTYWDIRTLWYCESCFQLVFQMPKIVFWNVEVGHLDFKTRPLQLT